MKESSSSEPSVEAVEEGARQARKGYDYQDLVAAGYCIQMLSEEPILCVECETSEDIVLIVRDAEAGDFREFVQVKSNRLDQKWTVAKLCASESKADAATKNSQIKKDQSILEKNALRQRGHSNAKFRMVTRTDVKDFDVLTVPTEDRDPQALDALTSAIHEKIEERTTLSRAEIEYWVQHVRWEVLGTKEALFNHNLRLLQEHIEESEKRVLPLFDLENLLRELVDEAQSMATATGRIGDNRSSITTEELRKWLTLKVKKIPQYLGSEERAALLRMERESVARCEAFWLALGVAQEEAESLARQPTIGARYDCFDDVSSGFHWFVATYGAGKSLAMEREFQRHLAKYCANEDDRVPIFLRAVHVGESLSRQITECLRELNRDNPTTKLFAIIDGVDEAGTGNSQRLLQECYEVSRTWPGSLVIATSTPFPSGFEKQRRPFPKLTRDLSAEIVGRFAGRKIGNWEPADKLGDDAGLALFCVLLGLALRETDTATPSKAELLHRVVDAARLRSGRDSTGWAEEHETLCKIAVHSTDSGGASVAIDLLGLEKTQLISLLKTRLISEDGGNLAFTVATMRFWFAMAALNDGLVAAADIADDCDRARNWVQPLAIFTATKAFSKSQPFLERLAARHPVIAAHIVADSTVEWGTGISRSDAELRILESQTEICLRSWLAGIGPLTSLTKFTDSTGDLLEIRGSSRGTMTEIDFMRPGDTKPQLYTMFREAVGPAGIWRRSLELTAGDVKKFVENVPLDQLDEQLLHEDLWNRIAGFVEGARWFGNHVEWGHVDRILSIDHAVGAAVERFRSLYPDSFPSPHPPADPPKDVTCWIPNFFTAETALARGTSIYEMALSAYQRIVRTYFPNFADDLRHSAWWPCRMVGVVVRHESKSSDHTGWSVTYHCEPVENDAEVGVEFISGSDEDYLAMTDPEALHSKVRLMRPGSPHGYWGASEALEFHDSHPATELVRKWLLSDLRDAGWML